MIRDLNGEVVSWNMLQSTTFWEELASVGCQGASIGAARWIREIGPVRR
jgi:hypothetical protein